MMEFIDVVFPLNLNPLTYKCPEHLRDKALPGMLVSAPLKNQIMRGIILGRSSTPITDTIKPISDIHGDTPLFEQPMLELLIWMSDYYLANKGIVLKNILPKEAFKKVKAKKSSNPPVPPPPWAEVRLIDEKILSRIGNAILKKEYKTFLFHAPTSAYEYSFVSKIVSSEKGMIVLVPEIAHIKHAESFMKDIVGDRLCVLHSGLSRGQRSDAIEKIMSGACTVVLGTRMAVFAPLKNLSLIAVMQEHSGSYKTEEGLRFSTRDVAVMRGYLEKATVLLTSISPSVESIYNAKKNKYIFLSLGLRPDADISRPKIKVLDMYNEKKLSPVLSKTVIDAATSAIKKEKKVMFIINRKGYSMLTCKECGHIETCGGCNIPLIFHKDDRSLRCHYCGFKSSSPERCKRCKSFALELTGSGIQRIEEDVKRFLDIEPVRLDSDRIKKRLRPDEISEMISGEAIVLGTKLLTKRLSDKSDFAVAAILNADIYLNLPDFRAIEKAYQEISSIADKVIPEGRVFIQTRMPQNYLFKFIRNYDYPGFCDEELAKRKAISYPPFSRLALLTFKGKGYDGDKVKDAVETISKKTGEIEILGPSSGIDRKGQKEHSLLFKTTLRKNLHIYVKEFLRLFEGQKDLKILIAIDP
jgi:primosomal protein N' (replication factor Y)